MGIGLVFQFAGDVVNVTIIDKTILFCNANGTGYSNIEGLKLSQSGVIKEFPDLKDNPNWRQEAIKRFKDKISNMKNETEISNYIIKELTKYGYKPLYRQKSGFRVEKI